MMLVQQQEENIYENGCQCLSCRHQCSQELAQVSTLIMHFQDEVYHGDRTETWFVQGDGTRDSPWFVFDESDVLCLS